jgi:hypothetical protein
VEVYVVKVTLLGTSPPVWKRILNADRGYRAEQKHDVVHPERLELKSQ